jgi:hypothetical protein
VSRWLIVAVLLVGVASACNGEEAVREATSDAAAPAGSAVVFSVFEDLPPTGACPGLYAVDARTRKISWLGGWDARREDTAVRPAFTADGTLSYAHWVDPSASVPLVDVFAGSRRVARANAFTGWAWSPRRDEVAFGRLADGGRRLELVLRSVGGATRVLAASAGLGISWLPSGGGLVYGRRGNSGDVITFVRRDGRDRSDLVRNAVSPLVSPDGRRVAFLRPTSPASGIQTVELWVVETRGGSALKVLGPAARTKLAHAAWLSNGELLVQRAGAYDAIFNVGDTLHRVDVDTGRERPFLKHAFALSVSPDGSRVLFVRPHRGDDTYYSIRTVRTDGRDEQVLAVTDEEDLNIRSLPVWKPVRARLRWIGDPAPPGTSKQECVRRLTSLRDKTR